MHFTPEVERARRDGLPIVALESSVFAQGLPSPANAEAATRMLSAVAESGSVPAITAVVRGTPTFGLTPEELERFLHRNDVRKAAARDLALVINAGVDAATTVSASLAMCSMAGISVFATGGIGGVHREPHFDESSDLTELSRTSAVVVCAGAKSILDLPATLERLETLGVPVVGFKTREFPGFFFESTGLSVSATLDDPEEIADVLLEQRQLGHPASLLVVQPPPAETALPRVEVDEAIERALMEARVAGVRGGAITPFLLAAIGRFTEGRSLLTNLALLEANARLAGQIARSLTRLGLPGAQ